MNMNWIQSTKNTIEYCHTTQYGHRYGLYFNILRKERDIIIQKDRNRKHDQNTKCKGTVRTLHKRSFDPVVVIVKAYEIQLLAWVPSAIHDGPFYRRFLCHLYPPGA